MPASKLARCLAAFVPLLAGAGVAAQEPPQEPAAPTTVRRAVPRLVKFAGHVGQTSRSVHPNAAEVPTGTLPAAKPVPSTASMTFAIYAGREGGTALWQETQNVVLDAEGRYSVLLGAASRDGMPAELFATGESRWLGVRVNAPGDAEASVEQTRVLLVSVPYALHAADAETLGGRAATEFVLREELAGWSGVAAGVLPGPADRPRVVGGTQGVVFATGAVSFMPRVTAINTPAAGDVTYGNSQIFDDGTNIRIGNPAVGTGLVNIELTTPLARNAFTSTLRLENTSAITGTVISAMSLTGADRATANHESFQVARFTLLKNVISTGLSTNFDAIFATTSFINQNAPYPIVGWRAEYPRVAVGMTLETYYGLFLEGPLGGGGTVTNSFAMVTAPGSGNVGIGTLAPAHLLDVAGDARVTGAIRAGQYLDLAGNPVVGSGDITDVIAGAGLSGGATTGAATLSLDTAFADARYLQLTGGTLTGAFNGTTGTFSGALTATSGTFSGTVSGPTGSFSSRLIARGTLEAAALGSATPTVGFNSASQVFFYSVHNGTSNLTQDFRWIAAPVGNGAPNPTGRIKLQWGNGVSLAGDTGLSISNAGIITFASGQTFPGGGGGGDITDVITLAGSGLQGGATTGAATLSLLQGCLSGQILKWDGVNWGCANDDIGAGGGGGDITDVIAGAGLTGGAASGAATLALDTAVTDARYLNATGDTLTGPLNGTTASFTGGFVTLSAITPNPDATAVFGHVTNLSGTNNIGVFGQVDQDSSVGVRGSNTANSGGGAGVLGTSFSVTGLGVQGLATNATGGTGVYGEAQGTSGLSVGVHGVTNSAAGYAGIFHNRTSGGTVLSGRADAGGLEVFRVEGTGAVLGTSFRDITTSQNVGLLLSCLTDQIMKFNGANWVCDNDATLPSTGTGDITAVFPGIGLTGGATTGDATLSLDTSFTDSRYARLLAANNFIANQTITGNLTVTGTSQLGAVNATSANFTLNSANPILNVVQNGPGIGGVFQASSSNPVITVNQTGDGHALVVSNGSTSGFGVRVNASAPTGTAVAVQAEVGSSTGIAGLFENTAGGPILVGRSIGAEKFRVDGSGNVLGNGFFDIFTTTRVSLRTDCLTDQIMKWNGTAWVCDNDAGGGGGGTGDITEVNAGAGLLGGALTGPATLSLDTTFTDTRYPQLGTTNTFAASQTINGDLSLTGTATVTGLGGTFTGINGGVVGRDTQTSGAFAGVQGISDSTTGIGVIGAATPATGATIGVRGTVNSTGANAAGVKGEANATTGIIYGVMGTTASANPSCCPAGVFGNATATSGNVSGVRGVSASTSGTGIRGVASATTGSTVGVDGSADSSAGTGVQGITFNATGATVGVRGTAFSSAGTGVLGSASSATGTTIGVQGTVASASGIAGVFDHTSTGDILLGRSGAGPTNRFRVDNSGNVLGASFRDLTTAKNVGLLLSCATNQVMQWNGSDWICATVSGGGGSGDLTDVIAGTGMSVTNGAGPQPIVSINTAVVPQLAVANTFTAGQTINNAPGTALFADGNVGVIGNTTASAGHGVRGLNSNGSGILGQGTTFGVQGQASGAGGTGIEGVATGTGNTKGVYGNVSSTTANAVGVLGDATGTTGATFGVWGRNSSTTANAAAVRGEATGTTGVIFGVSGTTSSSALTSAGVRGHASSVFGGLGVHGVADGLSGVGVHGEATGSSGSSVGVLGTAQSATGIGVYGQNLVNSSSATAGQFDVSNFSAIILRGRLGGAERFRVDAQGSVFANSFRDLATSKTVSLATNCTNGQVMSYDGTSWVCTTVPGLGGTIDADTLDGLDSTVFGRTSFFNNWTAGQSFGGGSCNCNLFTFTGNTTSTFTSLMRLTQSGVGDVLVVSATGAGNGIVVNTATGIGVNSVTTGGSTAIRGANVSAVISAGVFLNANGIGPILSLQGGAQSREFLSVAATGIASFRSTGTATAGGGFNSTTIEQTASAFSTLAAAAQDQIFRWQAEPVGNNTATPSAKLTLAFGQGVVPPAASGLEIAANGVITFAPGQTFQGSGRVNLPATTFQKFSGGASVVLSQGLLSGASGPSQFFAPVSLQTAQIVNRLRLCGRDNDNGGEIKATLLRKSINPADSAFNAPEVMATIASGPVFASTLLLCTETLVITSATIDNVNYTYYVVVELTDFVEVIAVQIDY